MKRLALAPWAGVSALLAWVGARYADPGVQAATATIENVLGIDLGTDEPQERAA